MKSFKEYINEKFGSPGTVHTVIQIPGLNKKDPLRPSPIFYELMKKDFNLYDYMHSFSAAKEMMKNPTADWRGLIFNSPQRI